jgi:GDP/UDP-N,N'-diacetylbacillosamine 2-epimerase (hydrolysing)
MQLGECPDSIFLVGGLGVDSIKRLQLLDKKTLENTLNLKFYTKNLLITFHPVTLEEETSEDQMKELLSALSTLKDTQLFFTLPNADTDSRILIKLIENFVREHDNARVYSSLGQLLYLSLLTQCDGMVGNSSSGLIEAPSLNKATINIGDRQRGRLQAKSVINCEPKQRNIINAFTKLYSIEFQETLKETKNPYGDGGASEKILKVLKSHSIKNIIKKSFYDLPDTVIKETI